MKHNSKEQRIKQAIDRLWEEKINYQGYAMKIVEYINSCNIIVEFQDEYKEHVHTTYRNFLKGKVKNPAWRIGSTAYNNQGCLMKIIIYNNANDIIVEFQDKYRTKVHTTYKCFLSGEIKNPYYPSVLNIGIVGEKYSVIINNKMTKEYQTWVSMLKRCYDKKYKEKYPTYQDATCCEEWLLYENFYEWLHSQRNFEKWKNGMRWCLDKDILVKGNKFYSPETCCLVPEYINLLFVKKSNKELFSGVTKNGKQFKAQYTNPITKKTEYLGNRPTPQEAFILYKHCKEESIKQIAQKEYEFGNITRRCYDAMMKYEVDI